MSGFAPPEGKHAHAPRAKPPASKPVVLSAFAGEETAGLELEADLAAQRALTLTGGSEGRSASSASSAGAPRAQPRCACRGPCGCAGDGLQRWPGGDLLSAAGDLLSAGVSVVRAALSPTIVEDDAEDVGEDQVRKSAFLAASRAAIVSAADDELASVGRSTANCPYIEYWWGRFRGYGAARMERAVILFASPATRSPSGYISAMAAAARQRVRQWIASGSAAVPDDIEAMTAVGDEPAGRDAQAKTETGAPASRSTVPDAILSRLSPGRGLDGAARARMERGFGRSFRDVRIHTDSTASQIAGERGALALTVGSNILFRHGHFQPGTTAGDVLLAHELAHTIQQRGGGATGLADDGHEADADRVAAQAVVAGHGRGPAPSVSERTGLAVHACNPTRKRCPPGMGWGNVAHESGTMGAGSFGCACVYRCVPQTYYPDEPSICPAGGCRRITYEIVDENYQFTVDGELQEVPVSSRASPDEVARGWGASSTPLTGEHACLCGGVDIEGDPTGAREAVSITPIAVDATDVVGPLAEVAGARRASNPTTGVREPETIDATPRRVDPMTPPPSHVGEPPTREPNPGGMSTRPRVGEIDLFSPYPHVEQLQSNWCGAACGEMAARRLGVEIDQGALARTPHFEPAYVADGRVVRAGGFQTRGLSDALTDVAPVAGRRWVGGAITQDISTPDGLRTHLDGYLTSTDSSVILRVHGSDHWIIVDRVMPDGRIAIRDPAERRSTLVTAEQLAGMAPTGEAVFSFPEHP